MMLLLLGSTCGDREGLVLSMVLERIRMTHGERTRRAMGHIVQHPFP